MRTSSPPPRANFFDASALVKVFGKEPDGEELRDYWNSRSPTKHTTPFCFYEAMGVLKGKWLARKELTQDEYFDATLRLFAWYNAATRYANDVDLQEPTVFFKVQDLAARHSLDLSDALQILSVKEGYFSALANESRTILVTADRRLANAARTEGLRVWYCLGDPEP